MSTNMVSTYNKRQLERSFILFYLLMEEIEIYCDFCNELAYSPSKFSCDRIVCFFCLQDDTHGLECDQTCKTQPFTSEEQSALSSFPVPCGNMDMGCQSSPTLASFASHSRVCPYRLITCSTCKESIPACQMPLHRVSLCTSRPVWCSVPRCGKEMPLFELDNHISLHLTCMYCNQPYTINHDHHQHQQTHCPECNLKLPTCHLFQHVKTTHVTQDWCSDFLSMTHYQSSIDKLIDLMTQPIRSASQAASQLSVTWVPVGTSCHTAHRNQLCAAVHEYGRARVYSLAASGSKRRGSITPMDRSDKYSFRVVGDGPCAVGVERIQDGHYTHVPYMSVCTHVGTALIDTQTLMDLDEYQAINVTFGHGDRLDLYLQPETVDNGHVLRTAMILIKNNDAFQAGVVFLPASDYAVTGIAIGNDVRLEVTACLIGIDPARQLNLEAGGQRMERLYHLNSAMERQYMFNTADCARRSPLWYVSEKQQGILKSREDQIVRHRDSRGMPGKPHQPHYLVCTNWPRCTAGSFNVHQELEHRGECEHNRCVYCHQELTAFQFRHLTAHLSSCEPYCTKLRAAFPALGTEELKTPHVLSSASVSGPHFHRVLDERGGANSAWISYPGVAPLKTWRWDFQLHGSTCSPFLDPRLDLDIQLLQLSPAEVPPFTDSAVPLLYRPRQALSMHRSVPKIRLNLHPRQSDSDQRISGMRLHKYETGSILSVVIDFSDLKHPISTFLIDGVIATRKQCHRTIYGEWVAPKSSCQISIAPPYSLYVRIIKPDLSLTYLPPPDGKMPTTGVERCPLAVALSKKGGKIESYHPKSLLPAYLHMLPGQCSLQYKKQPGGYYCPACKRHLAPNKISEHSLECDVLQQHMMSFNPFSPNRHPSSASSHALSPLQYSLGGRRVYRGDEGRMPNYHAAIPIPMPIPIDSRPGSAARPIRGGGVCVWRLGVSGGCTIGMHFRRGISWDALAVYHSEEASTTYDDPFVVYPTRRNPHTFQSRDVVTVVLDLERCRLSCSTQMNSSMHGGFGCMPEIWQFAFPRDKPSPKRQDVHTVYITRGKYQEAVLAASLPSNASVTVLGFQWQPSDPDPVQMACDTCNTRLGSAVSRHLGDHLVHMSQHCPNHVNGCDHYPENPAHLKTCTHYHCAGCKSRQTSQEDHLQHSIGCPSLMRLCTSFLPSKGIKLGIQGRMAVRKKGKSFQATWLSHSGFRKGKHVWKLLLTGKWVVGVSLPPHRIPSLNAGAEFPGHSALQGSVGLTYEGMVACDSTGEKASFDPVKRDDGLFHITMVLDMWRMQLTWQQGDAVQVTRLPALLSGSGLLPMVGMRKKGSSVEILEYTYSM
eukprot:gnl/Dysnectes_brevis/2395_a2839_601.p1 GENE.gnl/Dysnectes_brevis/2395_a2839_601~~gnl/Dysnectes_brevis/2395_a2839_601.p1  ORF type:complete len:1334 (-),score=206.12 gnl/Dysnectes_brevis/2395_a2839_601:2168-6169(-)